MGLPRRFPYISIKPRYFRLRPVGGVVLAAGKEVPVVGQADDHLDGVR